MGRKISAILTCLIIGSFTFNALAANVTTVKCGTAYSSFIIGYEDHELADDGHIILGEGLQDSKAIYKFYFPPPYGGNNITSVEVSIYGSGGITDLWIGGADGINYNSVTGNWSQGFDDAILTANGDDVGGYALEIQVDVTGFLDEYDLEKIVVTFDYSNVSDVYMKNFMEAYLGYLAIDGYYGIINQYWSDDNIFDVMFIEGMHAAFEFTSAFSGLNTSTIPQSVKTFSDGIKNIFTMGDIFAGAVGYAVDIIEFDGNYNNTDLANGGDIITYCSNAANADQRQLFLPSGDN